MADVVDTVETARLSAMDTRVTAAVVTLAQTGERVTGHMRITATAPEDVNTEESATTTACFTLDVDPAFAVQAGTWESLTRAEC